MAAASRKANGQAIRAAREAFLLERQHIQILKCNPGADLTQERLAILVVSMYPKRVEFSAKTVSRAERSLRVEEESLFMIGRALGLPFDHTWLPDSEDSADDLLEQMHACDRQRNYAKAEEIGIHLLQRADLTDDQYGETCVEVAVIRAHDKRWEEGIDLLEEHLAAGSLRKKYHLWAQFQGCILRREYAEELMARAFGTRTAAASQLLAEARTVLKGLIEPAGNGLRVAARHQLGVLEQLDSRWDEALGLFRQCLDEREQARARGEESQTGAPFRRAYEHRRMAQCHAAAGSRELATFHFREALELTKDHKRLEREVRRDMAAWDIALPGRPAASAAG